MIKRWQYILTLVVHYHYHYHYHYPSVFEVVPDFSTVVVILEEEMRYSHLTIYPKRYARGFISLSCHGYVANPYVNDVPIYCMIALLAMQQQSQCQWSFLESGDNNKLDRTRISGLKHHTTFVAISSKHCRDDSCKHNNCPVSLSQNCTKISGLDLNPITSEGSQYATACQIAGHASHSISRKCIKSPNLTSFTKS